MNRVRIGKDFNVRWSLYDKDGAPYELTAETLLLRYVSPYGRVIAEDVRVEGNVIEWIFRGRDQKHLGKYALELVQRDGLDGMITVDTINAFELVAHSYQETNNEDGRVVVESVQLEGSTSLIPVSIPTDDAFSDVSTNAIANKVVTLEFRSVWEKIDEVAGTLNKRIDETNAAVDELKEVVATKKEVEQVQTALSDSIRKNRECITELERTVASKDYVNAVAKTLFKDIGRVEAKVDKNKEDTDKAINKTNDFIAEVSRRVGDNALEISYLRNILEMFTKSKFFENNILGSAYVGFLRLGTN